jgi:hypothetical protein
MAKLYGMKAELETLGAVAKQAPIQRNSRYGKFDSHISPKPDMLNKGKFGRYDKTVLSPENQAKVDAFHARKGK